MNKLADVPQVTPEQILESIRESQRVVVDTVRAWRGSLEKLAAEQSAAADAVQFPAPNDLPKPDELIDSSFDFAKQLLESQREFAHNLIDASAGRSAPAAKRPAKK
jgi:hypothetical protein